MGTDSLLGEVELVLTVPSCPPRVPEVSQGHGAGPGWWLGRRGFSEAAGLLGAGGSAADEALSQVALDALERDALLGHRVALAHGDGPVLGRVEVVGQAEGRADLVLAAVAAGMTITRSGVMRTAPLAMRLRANSTWAMLEFVFNGMVFLLLGLQLPDILSSSLVAAEADPNVETWMLFTDIILIYAALMLVRFGWLWSMRKLSQRFLKKKPMEFGSWTTRELLISSVAGVRGAITLAGVLSIPLLLPDGNVFPARYELIFLAAGVILFSLFVGVIALPILLRHIESSDNVQQRKEERLARAATADVAIVAIQKMEERLAADTKENIDTQLLTEVSSRVIGNLRRRADGRNDVETSMLEESLERRFRLAALRSERGELYHLRATRQISNETLQKLLHDLDLLEALLIEDQ